MNLPWEKFTELPGDGRRNWELLCREVVRRQYEEYGPMLTRKQQPGVEFHLKVQRGGSELGEPGRHWGWQCKWFERDAFRANGRLRVDQRSSIEKAIAKSAESLPTLTDWVLWSKEKLSADDQRWFEALRAPFTLHQADEESLAGMLTGRAEILRQTWFGDLVLDSETLADHWREALAPIAGRYVSDLHIEVPARGKLTDYFPDSDLLDETIQLQGDLAQVEHEVIQVAEGTSNKSVGDLARDAVRTLVQARERLVDIAIVFSDGELPDVSRVAFGNEQRAESVVLEERIAQVIDRRDREAFAFGQATRALREVEGLSARLEMALATPLLAVVGAAGAGKTHLAASLSDPGGPTAGALVLGQQFGAEIEDDDLARKAGIGRRREDLLEALEAVGVRDGRRVPLVIDGLNESRDPRSWEVTLSRLAERLKRLPHVIAIVTLRPSYRELALPEDVPTIEIEGFEGAEDEAVSRYFDYYKIDADPAAIEWWRPSEPLLLSIFCRTVNPNRVRRVGTGDLPGSLHDVFDQYVRDVIDRIAGRLRSDPRRVRRCLIDLAQRFLDGRRRELDSEMVTEILEEDHWADWEHSLRFQLDAEGLLQRDVVGTAELLAWSYDLLGGHLIAEAILARHPEREEIATQSTTESLIDHPLREDIVVGLTGLLASEGGELHALLDGLEPLSAEATLASARLAGAEIGEAAVEAMRRLFASRPREVLDAISPAALRSGHPFNGRFLDALLGGEIDVWRRDFHWTEWIHQRTDTTTAQLGELARRWSDGELGPEEDAPLAWATWLLTVSDERLRYEAIHALYELGRRKPHLLFSRTLEMLRLNDPTVPEGLLAASYGVAMSMQAAGGDEQTYLLDFAHELQARILGDEATQPTSHWLIREYAYRTTQLAAWLSNGAFQARPDAAQPRLPEPPDQLVPFEPGGDGWKEVDAAFGNRGPQYYKIGRLVDARLPYWVENPRLLAVACEIRTRVADLGFAKIEDLRRRPIFSGAARRDNPYGRKYGWVAFYEAAGRQSDRGELRVDQEVHDDWRIPALPIDPSFPRTIYTEPPEVAEWAPVGGNTERWLRSGCVDLPASLLRRDEYGATWIVANAHLLRQSDDEDKLVSCSIRGMLALDSWEDISAHFAEHGIGHKGFPEKPGGRNYFAGEAPWAVPFDSSTTDGDGRVTPEVRRLGPLEDGPRIEVLAVRFDWERDRLDPDRPRDGMLPSKPFSRFAGLRKLAATLEFVDPVGQPGARCATVRGTGWSGHLLFVRRDLLEAYGARRGGEWGWSIWGFREFVGIDGLGAHELRSGAAGCVEHEPEHCFEKIVSLVDLKEGM